MKTVRFLGALLSTTAVIITIICLVQSLSGSAPLLMKNMTGVDKVFLFFMLGGCASFYTIVAIASILNMKSNTHKTIAQILILSAVVCSVGILYHALSGNLW